MARAVHYELIHDFCGPRNLAVLEFHSSLKYRLLSFMHIYIEVQNFKQDTVPRVSGDDGALIL